MPPHSGILFMGTKMITVGTDEGYVILLLKEDGGFEIRATLSPLGAQYLAEQLLLAAKQMGEYSTDSDEPEDGPNV